MIKKTTPTPMNWHVKALSPYGLAPETQRFLNQSVNIAGVTTQAFKLCDVIMSRVVSGLFDDTRFPCGVVLLGCAQTGYCEEFEAFTTRILDRINRDQEEKVVHTEAMVFGMQQGSFHICVAMPVRNVSDNDQASCLKESLLPHFERMRLVWIWCQALFAHYIVPANKVFVLAGVMKQTQQMFGQNVCHQTEVARMY